jgi:positive regulator of sigma E activity
MGDGTESLQETGVVLRVLPGAPGEGQRVMVRVEPGDQCAGCGASALCQAAADDRHEIEADDPLGCVAGDQVRIEVPGGQVLRMSFLVYGLPLGCLLVGVGLGALLLPAGRWRDPGSFLLAVGFAAAAFPITRLLAGHHDKAGTTLRARVVERASALPAGSNRRERSDQAPGLRPTSTP